MNEHPVRFGPTHGMSGIVTAPVDADSGSRRALLLSNVGMLSRIGPFRLYVELARVVGDVGWWALRFDESGMGDSEPRASGRTRSMDGTRKGCIRRALPSRACWSSSRRTLAG